MICRVCGNSDKKRLFKVREMMFGTMEKFIYFECNECGCLQIKDITEDMSPYYPGEYYSYSPVARRGPIVRRLVNLRNQYALWGTGIVGKVLQNIHKNYKLASLFPLSLNRDARILDIGCGAGKVLLSLSEIGFKNLLGVDPFIDGDIHYENGLEIKKGNLHEVNGKWDVIMFHHSFEHLSDPISSLQLVESLLNDGGYCVIRIPTVSSYAWKKYRENWVELDAPRHFFLHSIESIERLAERSHLQLVDVVCDSTEFQFWGSEQYLRGIPLSSEHSFGVDPKGSIFSRREIRSFRKRAKELNEVQQGDRAVFYLKKENQVK